MYTVGKIFDRRQPRSLWLVALEICVEQPLETREYIAVLLTPRIELPVVETHTVIQQQFYMVYYLSPSGIVYWRYNF